MKEQEYKDMVARIVSHITREEFDKHHLSVSDGLSVLSGVCVYIVEVLCLAISEKPKRMMDSFCEAIKGAVVNPNDIIAS